MCVSVYYMCLGWGSLTHFPVWNSFQVWFDLHQVCCIDLCLLCTGTFPLCFWNRVLDPSASVLLKCWVASFILWLFLEFVSRVRLFFVNLLPSVLYGICGVFCWLLLIFGDSINDVLWTKRNLTIRKHINLHRKANQFKDRFTKSVFKNCQANGCV